MNQAKCTTCGAGLTIKKGDKTCVCEYCQSTNIVENALALGKVEVDVTEDIKKLRANLTTFVQQNSIDEILRVSQKLLDWIPQDFVALYFFGYAKQQQNQPRFLYDFYGNAPVYTNEDFQIVSDHIIRKSELRDKARVISFLEAHSFELVKQFIKVHKQREEQEDFYANVPRDVFVCFSSYNQEIAQTVVKELEADGNTCWISTRNLRPEDVDNYWMNIEHAVQNCSVFLVISSEESMRSKDVHKEIDFARRYNKKMVEFKIDDSPHNTLFKHVFDGNKWVKGSLNLNQSFSGLLQRIYDERINSTSMTPKTKKVTIQRRPWRYPMITFVRTQFKRFINSRIKQSANQSNKDKSIGRTIRWRIPVLVSLSLFAIAMITFSTQIIDFSGLRWFDQTPPSLSLIGPSRIVLEAVSEAYIEQGIEAIDEVDGPVEYVVIGDVNTNKVGEYRIVYTAADSSGNEASIERIVEVVDTTPPTMQLMGPEEWVLTVGATFVEVGVIVSDLVDGLIQMNELKIAGVPNMDQIGDYEITYTATDKSNNSRSIKRIVRVVPAIVCENCQSRLNWELYEVTTPNSVWTNYNGIYSPSITEEFDRLYEISTKLGEGTSLIEDDIVAINIQFSSAISNNSIISWVGNSDNSISSILGIEVPERNFAIVINGYFVPTQTGTYLFTISTDDAADVFIDDRLVIGAYGARSLTFIGNPSREIELQKNVAYPIRIRYQDGGGGNSGFALYWRKASLSQVWIQDSNELFNVNPYE
jgi:hypothetical protein